MNTGFIGIGSMGGMLVRALVRAGALDPQQVCVANRSQAKLDALAAHSPGIQVVGSRPLAAQCQTIFVCVGPKDMPAVLAEIDPELTRGHLLVTTSAAVSLKALEDRVPCRVATVIPSITQEVGSGITLLIYGSRVTEADRHLLEGLLGRISHPVVISEALERPAIGLASGGPAFIAYVLQSMAEEAARSNSGLSPELANRLVEETAGATMKLITEGNMTPQEIIRRVAVAGGMTALGIEILSRYVPEAWQSLFRETASRDAKSRQSLVL